VEVEGKGKGKGKVIDEHSSILLKDWKKTRVKISLVTYRSPYWDFVKGCPPNTAMNC